MTLIQIEDNLWKKKRKSSSSYDYFVKSICSYCGKEFLQYKNRITKYCSKTCNSVATNNYILDANSIEIMNGLLLSDGCLQYRNDSLNACFTQSCKHKEYLKYLQDILSFPCKIASYNYIDKRWLKRIYTNQLTTKQSKLFSDLHKKWYLKNKKEVPSDLRLTPTSLLHWFLGDGYENKTSINLCTESFSDDSIQYLLAELKKINIVANCTTRRRIYVSNKYHLEFLKIIGKCPTQCFDYKWSHCPQKSYFNRKCILCGCEFDAKNKNKMYCSIKCIQKQYKNNTKSV